MSDEVAGKYKTALCMRLKGTLICLLQGLEKLLNRTVWAATEQIETRESLIQLKVNLSLFDITEDNDNIKDNKKDIANTPYRPVLTGLMNTQRR